MKLREHINLFEQDVVGENDKNFLISGYATTDGSGLWSSAIKKLHVEIHADFYLWSDDINEDTLKKIMKDKIPLDVATHYFSGLADAFSGFINIYFDITEWDVTQLGLIYTDYGFMKDAHKLVKAAGIKNYDDFGYSEQGTQTPDAVNCDVGSALIFELIQSGYPYKTYD